MWDGEWNLISSLKSLKAKPRRSLKYFRRTFVNIYLDDDLCWMPLRTPPIIPRKERDLNWDPQNPLYHISHWSTVHV